MMTQFLLLWRMSENIHYVETMRYNPKVKAGGGDFDLNR